VASANFAAGSASTQFPPASQQGGQGSRAATSRRNMHIAAGFSPSLIALLHMAHSQEMPPPASIPGGGRALHFIQWQL